MNGRRGRSEVHVIVALTAIAVIVVLGLAYAGFADGPPTAVLFGLAVCLAAGMIIGAQLVRHLGGRTPWRGGARRGLPGWSELRRELDRSRRSGHALALIRVAPPRRGGGDAQAARQSIAEAAEGMLRSCDSVWIDAGAVYMLLPESSTAGAGATVDRLGKQLPVLEMDTSIVSFPEDGWTSEVLLAKLHGYQVSGIAFVERLELERRQRAQQAKRTEMSHANARSRSRSRSRRQDREAS